MSGYRCGSVLVAVVVGTLIMQTCGPTLRIMERSSAWEVTSIETQRLVRLVRMISISRMASGLVVFAAIDWYDMAIIVVVHESKLMMCSSN